MSRRSKQPIASDPRPQTSLFSPAAPAAGSASGSSHSVSQTAIPSNIVIATIDGAARGNPGPAAFGAVFEDGAGKSLARLSSKLGKATNNVAEYRALLAALAYARGQGWRALKVRTDSELLARQLQGRYKVKSADLKPLHAEAQQLIASLDYFTVEAVPRKLTRPADKLANAALDSRPVKKEAGGHGLSRAESSKKKKGAFRSEAEIPPVLSEVEGRGLREAPEGKTIRALYQDGVLKPLESLDLPEGVEVEITLRPKKS